VIGEAAVIQVTNRAVPDPGSGRIVLRMQAAGKQGTVVGAQPVRRERPLLARLSRSAYGCFLALSARTGRIGKGSKGSRAARRGIRVDSV